MSSRTPFALLLLLLVAAQGLAGQEEVSAVLRGEVRIAGEPLRQGMVVLHRVAPGSAGEVDSVAVGPQGRFRLVLPAIPDPGSRPEVYFASVRHLDILYFGPPIAAAVQLDSLYTIEVYDTLTAPRGGASVDVAVRNLFIEQVDGVWRATDLFQLRNDTDRTLVREVPENGDAWAEPGAGFDGGGVVWSYPLPEGAYDFEIGQSDLAPDAVSFSGARVNVSAPLPPGERLYLIRYALDDLAFDLPLPGFTEVMELLIKEPAPPLSVIGLQGDQPIELEPGSTYRRFAGSDLSEVIVTMMLAEEDQGIPKAWLAILLALVLSLLGVMAVRKQPKLPATAPAIFARERLLREIAALDEAFLRLENPDPDVRQEYLRKREALKEQARRTA